MKNFKIKKKQQLLYKKQHEKNRLNHRLCPSKYKQMPKHLHRITCSVNNVILKRYGLSLQRGKETEACNNNSCDAFCSFRANTFVPVDKV